MAGPTLFDVAQRAQVSKSTVSLVINGSQRVHATTAARVRQAIIELNYVPNRAARALQSGRTRLIGVVVSDITNPYFTELVRGVIVAAKAAGYDVFVFDTDYDPDQLVMHLDHLREYRPDGLILLTTERNLAAVQRLEELNLPAVLLNWAMTGRRVGEVAVDYEPGLAELVAHLLELDHRRLAFVTGPPQFYSATARERAFRAVLAAQSPSLSEQAHFFPGEFRLTAQTGVAVIESLRQIPPAERPTAVVASNDLMAISILRALAAEGWTVPETISVAGIDDISLAAYTTPALTTLRLPRQEMTRLAFRALKEMIEAPHLEASAQSVTPRLIVRHSVGPAARVSKNS